MYTYIYVCVYPHKKYINDCMIYKFGNIDHIFVSITRYIYMVFLYIRIFILFV